MVTVKRTHIGRKTHSFLLLDWQKNAGIYCHSEKVTVNRPPIGKPIPTASSSGSVSAYTSYSGIPDHV
jgi:hypothetical protein